jgi:hypothetical protein
LREISGKRSESADTSRRFAVRMSATSRSRMRVHSRFSNKKRGGWGSCSFEPTNFPHTPHGSRNTQARCPHFVLVGAQISGCCAANTHLARSESCRCLG